MVDLHASLQEQFGFDEFLPGQEQVIRILLEGHSAAAIFPTGSGKSLCYQLPATLFSGLTLVVSPLIALMKDQIDSLRERNIAAARLDSSLSEEDYRSVTAAIRSGTLKMLFVSPERIVNERFRNMIRGQEISLLAVDEAHCISAWGHNFRPDYLKLAAAATDLNATRVLALTATATPRVSDDMARAFTIQPENIVNTGFHRPNLEYRVTACEGHQRRSILLDRIRSRPAGPTIIYVTLQRHAEEIADHLSQNGFDARPYHAGMKADTRHEVQDAFMSGRLPMVCATIAFGMGIDKADIRYIYHYHLAKGFESYLQETGRAGRDGAPAVCELFACGDDVTTLENFAYGDTPDPESLRGVIDEILDAGDSFDLSFYSLARRHDMRKLVVSTLLTHLEIAGIIKSEGHFYSDIRYAPAMSNTEILAKYPEKQAGFLKGVFAASQMKKKWATLNMDRATQKTGHARAVVLRAMESLQEKGLAVVEYAGYQQRYSRTQANVDASELCVRMGELFLEHESREIARIDAMLDYAVQGKCLTGHLLAYFGEPLEGCGHCGICLGDTPAILPASPAPSVSADNVKGFASLIGQHPTALGRPRQQARFLCGLTSPAVSAIKNLRGHPLFGRTADSSFADVLTYCDNAF